MSFMPHPIQSAIVGLGTYVPPTVLGNLELAQRLGVTEDWIWQRSGIRQRHVTDADTSTADMALHACHASLDAAGVAPEDIDLIVVATSTPDHMLFPSTGAVVQARLGAKRAASFDISAACSGFVFGLHVADQFIRAGTCERVLLVCADALTKYVDYEDRATAILFGDGAAAVLLARSPGNCGILGSYIRTDGTGAKAMSVPAGGSRMPITSKAIETKGHLIHMDGVAIFRFAVKAAVDAFKRALELFALEPQDIHLVVMHQANSRILDHAARQLGLPPEKFFSNLEQNGNTSVASIPLALHDAVQQGRLRPGDLVMTIGFGAGLTWGVNVIKW